MCADTWFVCMACREMQRTPAYDRPLSERQEMGLWHWKTGHAFIDYRGGKTLYYRLRIRTSTSGYSVGVRAWPGIGIISSIP